MNLLLDIFALRNISKGKAKKNDNVDNVKQNSNLMSKKYDSAECIYVTAEKHVIYKDPL